MTPRRRREYLGALGGALAFVAVIGLLGGAISAFFRPMVQQEKPSSPGGALVFTIKPPLPPPSLTVGEQQAPGHLIDVRDPRTGRHVIGIDRDGSLHPDWRKKYRLLRKRCIRGCCTGDVREGKRPRVGH